MQEVVLDPCAYNTTHFLTPPPRAVETLATKNVIGLKLQKQRSRRKLGCHRHVQDADIIDGHTFPHKVEVDLDMLRALVLNRVGGEVDSADVVAVDEGALHQRSVELLK
jgi:hypothetical protein